MKQVLFVLVASAVVFSVYAQPPQNDPCRTCQIILNIAEHHFHNNITDQAALQQQLQQECQFLGQHEGQQATQNCLNVVNTNIDTIYSDLSSGKGITATCYDIGQCASLTTVSHPPFPTGSFPPLIAKKIRALRKH